VGGFFHNAPVYPFTVTARPIGGWAATGGFAVCAASSPIRRSALVWDARREQPSGLRFCLASRQPSHEYSNQFGSRPGNPG
jgi:hypothetical protein